MTINIHSLIHHIFSRTHKQHMDGKSMYIGKIGSWDVKKNANFLVGKLVSNSRCLLIEVICNIGVTWQSNLCCRPPA